MLLYVVTSAYACVSHQCAGATRFIGFGKDTIIATASSLSGVAGGPLAAELLELDGALHLHGWQVTHYPLA